MATEGFLDHRSYPQHADSPPTIHRTFASRLVRVQVPTMNFFPVEFTCIIFFQASLFNRVHGLNIVKLFIATGTLLREVK